MVEAFWVQLLASVGLRLFRLRQTLGHRPECHRGQANFLPVACQPSRVEMHQVDCLRACSLKPSKDELPWEQVARFWACILILVGLEAHPPFGDALLC